MGNVYELIAFILLGGCLVLSSLVVVSIKNLVHSVLWLIIVFLSLAGIFVLLNADFLAVVQVLVYAGGVCIMVVFGVMTVQRSNMTQSNTANFRFKYALPLAAVLFIIIGVLAARVTWLPGKTEVPADTIHALAPILLTDFVIPFEVAAILLTVALTGALLIVKEVRGNGKS